MKTRSLFVLTLEQLLINEAGLSIDGLARKLNRTRAGLRIPYCRKYLKAFFNVERINQTRTRITIDWDKTGEMKKVLIEKKQALLDAVELYTKYDRLLKVLEQVEGPQIEKRRAIDVLLCRK